MPGWYPTLKAAQYLGVPPWVIEGEYTPPRHVLEFWRWKALIAQGAENLAESTRAKNPEWYSK